MYFPEENYSHVKQEKFGSESNCESKPKIPELNKRKHVFTSYQLNELKQIFDKNKNQIPSIYIRKELAEKMGVSQMKISKWFHHKIRMWKRTSDCESESKCKRFESHERIELKRVFEKNHYPDKNIRNDLAQRMGISEFKIRKWFIDERHKLKKRVSSLTCAECYNFITSLTGDVNYPPVPFYSRAETMPPDHPYQHPQLQSRSATDFRDFSAAFFAEQYSSHYVPLTHQWTDFDTQSFSTVGSLDLQLSSYNDLSSIGVNSFMTHMSSDSFYAPTSSNYQKTNNHRLSSNPNFLFTMTRQNSDNSMLNTLDFVSSGLPTNFISHSQPQQQQRELAANTTNQSRNYIAGLDHRQ